MSEDVNYATLFIFRCSLYSIAPQNLGRSLSKYKACRHSLSDGRLPVRHIFNEGCYRKPRFATDRFRQWTVHLTVIPYGLFTLSCHRPATFVEKFRIFRQIFPWKPEYLLIMTSRTMHMTCSDMRKGTTKETLGKFWNQNMQCCLHLKWRRCHHSGQQLQPSCHGSLGSMPGQFM
jgi:hypothetical protein